MRKFYLIIFIQILFSLFNYAQPILNGSTTLTSTPTQIVQIVEGQNASYSYGAYAIGKEFSNQIAYIYRTYFEIYLNGVPSNATIQQATISYFTGGTGYTLKLTQLATINPSDLKSCWNAIGNGNTFHTGLVYGSQSFTSIPIKNAIQNNLSNGKLIIGVLSESENVNGSYASMILYIDITYTYPAASLTLQARNDLDGAD